MKEELTRMLDQAVEHIKDRRPDLHRPRGDIEMAMASVAGALSILSSKIACDRRLEQAVQLGHLGEIDRPIEIFTEIIQSKHYLIRRTYRDQVKETLFTIKKLVEEAS